MRIPASTYRLQLTAQWGLDRAAESAAGLATLGAD